MEANLSAGDGEEEEEPADRASGDGGGGGGIDFDPTEDELVLHFLRPQLRGFPPRVEGAVLEADPCGAAPWELLERYGLRERGHFFATRGRGRPVVRSAAGGEGAWMRSATKVGQSVTDLGVVVRWRRAKFCFYVPQPGPGQGRQVRSSGWVLEEYQITDPRCYRRADDEEEDPYWVLCRVRRSGDHGRRTEAGAGSGAGTTPPAWNRVPE